MQVDNENQVAVIKALSDPNRLNIIDMLSCGELCACKLLAHFRITQPTLSHHMKVLTDCGLVAGRKDGVWTHYSLNRAKMEEFIAFLRNLAENKDDCVCRQDAACCDGQECCGHTTGQGE